MIDENDTRWVRLWRGWRGTKRITETYQRISYIGSDDEKVLRDVAESWGTDMGPNSTEFSYGFSVVDKPPQDWIAQQIKTLKDKISTATAEIEELTKLIDQGLDA